MPVKRIAVIGPESSGKSVLCSQLAAHYQTLWVPEHAREYLPTLDRKYRVEDVVHIYMTQFEKEKNSLRHAQQYLFTDTEFIIARVWCENVFGFCPEEIFKLIEKHPYDYYLLTSPDLPWEPDPLRENPGRGAFFFDWYRQLLDEYGYNYGIVSGTGEVRLQNAIDVLSFL